MPEIAVSAAHWRHDGKHRKQFLGQHRVQFAAVNLVYGPVALASIHRLRGGAAPFPPSTAARIALVGWGATCRRIGTWHGARGAMHPKDGQLPLGENASAVAM
ncbi:MAG: hypothetical protein ACREOA_00920 [Candidatus Dormibacteria bacterium]